MNRVLNLSLELTSALSKEKCRLLTRHINAALSNSSELNGLVKNISVSVSTPITKFSPKEKQAVGINTSVGKFSPYEVGQAGGRARAARLSAEERARIARKAAFARWGTVPPPPRIKTRDLKKT